MLLRCDSYICSRYCFISAAACPWQSTWRYLAHWWCITQATAKTWQVFHIFTISVYTHTHILLGQETITDTSKNTHYMAATCLSLIFQTWLSQEHTRLTRDSLTVPAHLCCNCTPDLLLAVTTGHSLSQPVTTRCNQSRPVISLWSGGGGGKGGRVLQCLPEVFWSGIVHTDVSAGYNWPVKKIYIYFDFIYLSIA